MKMTQTFFTFLALSLLITPNTIFAHGGEDHGHEEQAAMAPKGGMLKEIKNGHLELVAKENSIEIYHYDLHVGPSQIKDVAIKAEYSFPRKPFKKLKLKPHRNHWSAPFNKGANHRYNLKIHLDDEVVEWVVD